MKIVADMPAPEYHGYPAASAGRLKYLLRSPAHYRASFHEAKTPTPAMQFGSAFHAWMEGKFDENYIAIPWDLPDGRTKVGKEARIEFARQAGDKNGISCEQIDAIKAMAESVYSHAKARELLLGLPEVSVFWTDEESGIECKCRPDRLIEDLDGLRVVVDWKTTEDAGEAFARQALNLGYPLAAAHYLAGTQADAFVWIAVEKTPPYAVNCYYASPEILRYGETKRRYCLTLLKQCQEAGEWPAYPQELQRLELPYWAK